MKERLSSPGLVRAVSWVSALILIAGVAAIVTVWVADSTDTKTAVVNNGETVPDELPATTAPDVSDVPEAARKAAATFILGAVTREDLASAWKVTHPQLKKDCACTYEEWLGGNIPVLFFPSQGADTIRFGANEVTPNRVVLEVLLVPKKGTDLSPTAFYVGLKTVGTGENEKWLVDYFAPIGSPPVPQSP